MNSKERVLAAIQHQKGDRLPIDFIARDEMIARLCDHFGVESGESLLQALQVDLRAVGPTIKTFASPFCYADPTVRVEWDGQSRQEVYYDLWGVGFVEKTALEGKYFDLLVHPLKDMHQLEDLEKYPFPSADLWDYECISRQIESQKEYFLWAHSRGVFEISWFMRGMENFLVDLLTNPAYAEYLMDRIMQYLMDRTLCILKAGGIGNIDCVEINDDVGGQTGLLISPALWRRFIKPRMAKMIQAYKQYDVLIRYHCCGGLREIIPDLIEIGVDILNPVQPLARGMNLRELKHEFGDRLTFNGGIDTQELLPHKTGKEYEAEVRDILQFMGENGGFIMAPSHALQVDVPLENVIRLYEWASCPYKQS